MKFEIEATIPVVQYGNIKPKFLIEEDGEETTALDKIKELWDKYGEKPLPDRSEGGEVIESFTGEKVLYNDNTHTYYDMDGNKLLSGSYYASQLMPKFDKEGALKNMATTYDVDAGDIDNIWEMLGDVSRNYGNAIHAALELYHNHKKTGEKISEKKGDDINYALSKLPHLSTCVKSFVDKFGDEAEMEVLVSDVGNKMAGRIDRLQILDEKKKVCRIGDFKTNHTLNKKKLLEYQHQLSFYAHILKNKGWTVEGLDIYHYTDDWEHHELEVLDLQPF